MTALLALGLVPLGLVVGSFLNVVIHRVPEKQSVVRPRSRCPRCQTTLKPWDNVPVVSWLLLHGRCRNCHGAISIRYPLVEVATAALFVAAALRLGDDDPAVLPAFLVVFAALLAISAVDLERFIVPNRILSPALFMSAPLLVVAAVIDGDWSSLLGAALGGVLAWVLLFAIHMASPKGMGFGDVRLAGLIGMLLGWLSIGHVLLGLFLAFLTAAVVGVGLMLTGVRGRKDRVPFGPFLALGAIAAVFVGGPILSWYGV
jgi:leader peptidase (prepilin peptidase)/N-methyltransferase